VVSEGFEFAQEALGGALGVFALEVVAAEVAVGLAGGEHVPVGDQHRVFDGAERAAVTDARLEALVLGGEVGALAARRGQGGFLERDPEPLGAFAGPSGAALAGRLVVAGAASGPGGEVPGGREDAHVDADLSDHDFRGSAGDAGHGARELDAGRERAQLLGDRFREPVDLLVEEVQVGEDRADHQRVVGFKAAPERFA